MEFQDSSFSAKNWNMIAMISKNVPSFESFLPIMGFGNWGQVTQFLEQVSMVFSCNFQQLAVEIKWSRTKSDKTVYQLCTEIVAQDPTLGTWVPPDSEIHAVSIQKLIDWIIFPHSVTYP